MNWKQGPLPPDTYQWGGVVKAGEDPAKGFSFADFQGDHVVLCPSGEKLTAIQVGWFNNSLDLPPGVLGRSPN